jgi:hypothetical protein
MEMTNIYIYGTIGALLCLVVGAMLGYARKEYQQVHANALQRDHLHAVDAKWRETVENARQHTLVYTERWQYADKFRAVLVQALTDLGIWDFSKHGSDPTEMLTMLVLHTAKQALDPSVSQKAKNLHTAGVRKGAKRVRLQMQKAQATVVADLERALFEAQGKRQIFKEAVINTLNDKVALPGVRKSIREAINVECERLRLASVKKGA